MQDDRDDFDDIEDGDSVNDDQMSFDELGLDEEHKRLLIEEGVHVDEEPAAAPAQEGDRTWLAFRKWFWPGLAAALALLLVNDYAATRADVQYLLGRDASLQKQSLYDAPADLRSAIATAGASSIMIGCNGWIGSAWAVDLEPSTDPADAALEREFPTTVVTNHHVIEDCVDKPRSVRARIDGVKSGAYLYSYDVDNDLALVMVKPDLKPLPVGPKPKPGMWVMTVGAPDGLEHTVSIGNVMNTEGTDVISSAPINGGNSGGPLLDARGRVVGTTTWVWMPSADDPTDVPQDWNVSVGIAALCDRLIDCEGDPEWTWEPRPAAA